MYAATLGSAHQAQAPKRRDVSPPPLLGTSLHPRSDLPTGRCLPDKIYMVLRMVVAVLLLTACSSSVTRVLVPADAALPQPKLSTVTPFYAALRQIYLAEAEQVSGPSGSADIESVCASLHAGGYRHLTRTDVQRCAALNACLLYTSPSPRDS